MSVRGRVCSAVLASLFVAGCVPPAQDAGARASPSAVPSAATASAATPEPARTVRGLADLVRSDVARAPSDSQTTARAAMALEALASDLYRDLASGSDDIVFSPYSVGTALAMTRLGAAGITALEIDAVLHSALAGDLHAGYNALDAALARRPGSYPLSPTTSAPLELATANQLWAQRDREFGADFLDGLAKYYGAGVRLVDFERAHEPARSAINEWVSGRTRARIPELIKQGVLSSQTRFVLTNAIYLKAKWSVPFSKHATTPSTFTRLDGSTTQVQMMRRGATSPYAKGAGYEAVRLAYVGGLSMVVIVPDAGAFRSFEDSLRDRQRLRQVIADLAPVHVSLSLPRFEFRTPTPLSTTLQRLGMPAAFDPNLADLSGISPRERLYLQAVVHEAFIAVDEEGTEAAAATAVVGGATGGPSHVVELKVDRPFLFLIRDDETGAILFMGRVLDPN